jgi:MFS transporter, DHA2 family, multidrug resistance protein
LTPVAGVALGRYDPDRQVGLATWLGFAAMGVGMFMAILDVQIVATALPTMHTALGIEPSSMS